MSVDFVIWAGETKCPMEFRTVGDRGLKGKSRMKLGKEDEDDGVLEGIKIGRRGGGEIFGGRRSSVDRKGWQAGLTERRECGTGMNWVRGGDDRRGWRCCVLAAAAAA